MGYSLKKFFESSSVRKFLLCDPAGNETVENFGTNQRKTSYEAVRPGREISPGMRHQSYETSSDQSRCSELV